MPSQIQSTDLHGTTAIVTGASDGIGAVTARERAGARVVLAVLSLAAHPGLSATNIASASGGLPGRLLRSLIALVGQDADGGARPTLYAATQPLPASTYVGPGGFMEVRGAPKPVKSSAESRDRMLARRLWARSAELTGVDALPAAA